MGGRTAILLGGRWYLTLFRDVKSFNWGFTMLPRASKGTRATPLTGMAWGVSAQTKHPKYAYEFAKYLTRSEGIRFLVEIGDSLPIRKNSSLWEECFEERERGFFKRIMEGDVILSSDIINPNLPISSVEMDERIVWPKIEKFLLGFASLDETLENIENEINKILLLRDI